MAHTEALSRESNSTYGRVPAAAVSLESAQGGFRVSGEEERGRRRGSAVKSPE